MNRVWDLTLGTSMEASALSGMDYLQGGYGNLMSVTRFELQTTIGGHLLSRACDQRGPSGHVGRPRLASSDEGAGDAVGITR